MSAATFHWRLVQTSSAEHSAAIDAGWCGKPYALGRDSGEGGHAKGASGAQSCMDSGSAGSGRIWWAGLARPDVLRSDLSTTAGAGARG